MGCFFTYPKGSYSIPASYTGVAFELKATFTGTCLTPPVHFKLADATTDPSGDANGVYLTVPSGVWTPVTVYFNQLVTEDYTGGVTQTHALSTATAWSLGWLVEYPGAGYNLAVDNVQFVTIAGPAVPAAPLPGSTAWPLALIANCELGNNSILINADRNGGSWGSYDNASVDTLCPESTIPFVMSPIASNPDGETCQNPYAAAITGTMGTGGYPGIGFTFLPQSGGYDQLYDIDTAPGGPYQGIQFYAMSGTGNATIAVEVPDANTDKNLPGATCTSYTNVCSAFPQTVISITGSWVFYQTSFASMAPPSWGENTVRTLDTAAAAKIQFQAQNPGAYSLWVDDVSFY
jgi:hypothetical protein